MKSIALALAIILVGCGDAPDTAPPAPAETTLRSVHESAPARCTDGDERACRLTYPTSIPGIVDCYESVQHCVDGAWAACGVPKET